MQRQPADVAFSLPAVAQQGSPLVVRGIFDGDGDAAKAFIEEYLNLLTIAFVLLLVIGFWVIGRGARRASRVEGEPLS